MQVKTILKKKVDLSALNGKDLKTRRLFILANGERTFEELCQLSGVDQGEASIIIKNLVDETYLEVVAAQQVKPGEGILISDELAEKITEALAHYVGPIAPVLVNNSLTPGQELSRDQFQSELRTLARHIEEYSEQSEFLDQTKAL
ncbi:MAG: hypothetical protein D6B25_20630 [Desulfobulbaceae bacterium]|nr:MAG: hypothetical protein D6B25_20630 [Desulfobulbaceae bacterium]